MFEQKDTRASFMEEISLMMFGFGDSNKPNSETVQLVENITLVQLQTIVQESLKYSSDSKTLKGEELIFLMRHNKNKMRRFVKYLRNKKMKCINLNSLGTFDLDIEEKPKGYLMQFIEKIDETGEYTDLSETDEVKHQRDLRAEKISQALDEEEYLEFSKARNASFSSRITMKNLEKLKVWIDPKGQIIFTLEALEVLAYLAYQTVAEMIDNAFLVRMDGKWKHDPLDCSGGSYYSATMFNSIHRMASEEDNIQPIIQSRHIPISVSEIKEVMRRIHSSKVGTINFGGKMPETHFCFAL